MKLSTALLAVALAAQPMAAHAYYDATQCQLLGDSYDEFIRGFRITATRYGSCVGMSKGDDDCSMQWQQMKNEQDELERYVRKKREVCK